MFKGIKMDERERLLRELFGDSKGYLTRAKIIKYDRMLKMIPNEKLIDFSIYMDSFRGEFVSTELAMYRALTEYKKAVALNMIRKGESYFKSIKEVEEFIKEAFRGRDLFSGGNGAPYIEGVVICVDKDGELRNKYIVNQNGVFQRLDSEDCQRVYQFLFENQNRIGAVSYKNPKEIELQISSNKEQLLKKDDAPAPQNQKSNNKAVQMIEALAKSKTIKGGE